MFDVTIRQRFFAPESSAQLLVVKRVANIILNLIFPFLAIGVCLWFIWTIQIAMESRVQESPYPIVSEEVLKQRMAFHGALFAKQDRNYQWYFTRDGKQCPLFKEGE